MIGFHRHLGRVQSGSRRHRLVSPLGDMPHLPLVTASSCSLHGRFSRPVRHGADRPDVSRASGRVRCVIERCQPRIQPLHGSVCDHASLLGNGRGTARPSSDRARHLHSLLGGQPRSSGRPDPGHVRRGPSGPRGGKRVHHAVAPRRSCRDGARGAVRPRGRRVFQLPGSRCGTRSAGRRIGGRHVLAIGVHRNSRRGCVAGGNASRRRTASRCVSSTASTAAQSADDRSGVRLLLRCGRSGRGCCSGRGRGKGPT